MRTRRRWTAGGLLRVRGGSDSFAVEACEGHISSRLDLGSKGREFPAAIPMVEEVDEATEQLIQMIVGAFERSSRVMSFRGHQKMPWGR